MRDIWTYYIPPIYLCILRHIPGWRSSSRYRWNRFYAEKVKLSRLKNHKSLLNSLARVPLNTLPSFRSIEYLFYYLCALPLGIYSRPVSGLSPFLLSTISSNFKNTSNRGCANDPNFISRKKWNYRISKKFYDHGLFFMLNHIVRLNSQNFQNFLFEAQIVIFVQKGWPGWITGFLRIHPKYDFRYFPEIDHSDNGYFRGKFQKSYMGWLRKIPRIIFVIFPQNDNLGLKKWHFTEFSLLMIQDTWLWRILKFLSVIVKIPNRNRNYYGCQIGS